MFHKMDSSFYPFMFGFGVLGIGYGLVLFMCFGLFYTLFFCLFYVFYISFLWIKDIVLEDISGEYSFYDNVMFGQGFRLFLFSELVLFLSIFWTFLDSSLCPLFWYGGVWFPEGLLSSSYIGLNSLASLFLMMNSQILKYSRRFLCLNLYNCEFYLIICIFIGGGFLCFQFFEYSGGNVVISDCIYGSVFYLGTGLHGFHVFIGVFFIIINFFRIKMFNFNWYCVQSYDLMIDYWRFLEWMWGVMFCLLYILGS